MKIAVNTRLLLKDRMEGTGWYTYEILKRMVANHPEVEFIFFFDRPYDKKFIFGSNVTPVILSPPARHPILFIIWFDIAVSRALKKYKPDLFLSPDGHLSLRTDVPSVPVIHDLNFKHHPELVPGIAGWYYNRYFPKFAKKACRIVTVSQFSKKDIVASYDIDPSSIDVVYNGIKDGFDPPSKERKAELKKKWTDGADYFIYIGSLIPRKNLKGLLEAFDKFKQNDPDSTQRLVVVGAGMWGGTYIEEVLKQIKSRDEIIFCGHLQQDELSSLLGAAEALVFVPFFEGFGVPVIEAFSVQTPVITSNITSLPEVAGEAAILVDPHDSSAIAAAMRKVTSDPVLRRGLIEKGVEQLRKFNWDDSAIALWDSLERCLTEAKSQG